MFMSTISPTIEIEVEGPILFVYGMVSIRGMAVSACFFKIVGNNGCQNSFIFGHSFLYNILLNLETTLSNLFFKIAASIKNGL